MSNSVPTVSELILLMERTLLPAIRSVEEAQKGTREVRTDVLRSFRQEVHNTAVKIVNLAEMFLHEEPNPDDFQHIAALQHDVLMLLPSLPTKTDIVPAVLSDLRAHVLTFLKEAIPVSPKEQQFAAFVRDTLLQEAEVMRGYESGKEFPLPPGALMRQREWVAMHARAARAMAREAQLQSPSVRDLVQYLREKDEMLRELNGMSPGFFTELAAKIHRCSAAV